MPKEDKEPPLPGFTARHRLLFVGTYLCYIAVNTAPNALMPATQTAIGLTSGDVAFIGSWQTIGLAFGKCVWGGWPADLFGARRTYMWTMLALAGAVVIMPAMTTKIHLAVMLTALEFVATPAAPCHVRWIGAWMPPEATSHGFWLLGVASRGGDMLGKLCFGALLTWATREQTATAAATVGLAGAFLGGWYHVDAPGRRDVGGAAAAPSELRDVLRRILTAKPFWRAAAALSSTCVLKRTLETLAPVFFFASSSVVSQGEAAQLASAWPAGILASMLVGGVFFNRASARGKVALILAMMGVTFGGCVALAAVSATIADTRAEVWLRVLLTFSTAFGIGLPYYVPIGMFAVRFGGSSSGVVSAYLDVVAFVVSAVFLALLRPVLDEAGAAGWFAMWRALAAVSLAMVACNFVFLRDLLLEKPDDASGRS